MDLRENIVNQIANLSAKNLYIYNDEKRVKNCFKNENSSYRLRNSV